MHSKSTIAKVSESSDEFELACETIVRFVQDSIAEAVDPQKRNADKNGMANVLLFNEGDLFLLSTVKRRLGNVYTIELPRKMSMHLTFYVGLLMPYYEYESSFGELVLAIKHLQEIPVLAVLTLSPRLKIGYLPAKPSDILTSFH